MNLLLYGCMTAVDFWDALLLTRPRAKFSRLARLLQGRRLKSDMRLERNHLAKFPQKFNAKSFQKFCCLQHVRPQGYENLKCTFTFLFRDASLAEPPRSSRASRAGPGQLGRASPTRPARPSGRRSHVRELRSACVNFGVKLALTSCVNSA